MSLKTQIEADIKAAMLAKNQDELRALRAIKSMILLEQTSGSGKEGMTEEEEIQLLMKAVKQRKDSAETYKQQNREDLYQKEIGEVAVIQKYLPKQLSPEELETEIKKIIEQTGASSMKEMGKVMGIANKTLSGKAEGKAISEVVKKLLS